MRRRLVAHHMVALEREMEARIAAVGAGVAQVVSRMAGAPKRKGGPRPGEHVDVSPSGQGLFSALTHGG